MSDCYRCSREHDETPGPYRCPVCDSRQCPKAGDHRTECMEQR